MLSSNCLRFTGAFYCFFGSEIAAVHGRASKRVRNNKYMLLKEACGYAMIWLCFSALPFCFL